MILKSFTKISLDVVYYIVLIFCVTSLLQVFIGSKYGRESELFDFILSFSWLGMFETLKELLKKINTNHND